MVIRNRILSFLYRLIATAVGILGLILIFECDTIDGLYWNPLRYFPNLVTIFGVIVLLTETILSFFWVINKNKKGLPQTFGQMLFLALALEMAILLGHPLYFCFINGFNSSAAYFAYDRLWAQLILYVIFPILTLFDWLLFSEKGNWKWHWTIYFVSVPLYYTGFSLINHYVRTSTTFATLIFDHVSFLNYPFLGIADGWVGVFVSSFSLLLLYLAIAYLLIFFSFLLSGKYSSKRRISIESRESI